MCPEKKCVWRKSRFRRRNVYGKEMCLEEIKFPTEKCVRRKSVSGDEVFGEEMCIEKIEFPKEKCIRSTSRNVPGGEMYP